MSNSLFFSPVVNAPKDTQIPKRSTLGSAGYDFFAPCTITIEPGACTPIIPLNIKAIMPSCFYLQLHNRSSLAAKHCIVLETSGVIDSDYANNKQNDGNIGIKLRNNGHTPFTIEKGDKICQGIFLAYYTVCNDVCEEVRNGGYGSTGK